MNHRWPKVLRSLMPHLEPLGKDDAPVSAAYRYLEQRSDHLNYADAQKKKLPIGSGEIESGHRHVVQKRLKLAGSCWKESNAQRMLNLRTARENNYWTPTGT